MLLSIERDAACGFEIILEILSRVKNRLAGRRVKIYLERWKEKCKMVRVELMGEELTT